MINENINVKGEYFFYLDKKLIRRQKNTLIYEQTKNLLNVLLGYTPPSMIIRYCALGTDDTAATTNDTLLGAEGARVYRVNLTRYGNVVTSDFTFTELLAVGTWSEVGIFCGSGATDTTDSGLLWSRAVLDPTITKASGQELTIRHVTTWSY